jgi:hypothetical protein
MDYDCDNGSYIGQYWMITQGLESKNIDLSKTNFRSQGSMNGLLEEKRWSTSWWSMKTNVCGG